MNKRSGSVTVPLGLGARIRAAREKTGLSQSELGRAVGVSKSAVSQWEKGAVQNLKLGNLFATARALDIDVRALVFGDGRGASPKARPGQKSDERLKDNTGQYGDIPADHLALIRRYAELPKNARTHIRALILLLADDPPDRSA